MIRRQRNRTRVCRQEKLSLKSQIVWCTLSPLTLNNNREQMKNNNRLSHANSPYLKQHANNPVEWYPWCDDAFLKARQENKPILLSIGYSACHWCHVMAHESFEDQATADIMNQFFVNIKVDREEHPDLDKVYQTAHYFLTRRNGGWPLTLFLTPDDLTPFFSGTYFPREAKYQLPAFKEILQTIHDIHHKNLSDIKEQNQALLSALNTPVPSSSIALTENALQTGIQMLREDFDEIHGGFGDAPKFPNPSKLEYLLYSSLQISQKTLTRMAEGGIYDQLGGGFYRYSVDAAWRIPHFEKMLYDNAQLLMLYALAGKQSNEPLFLQCANETAEWLITTMQAPDGGFYSSIDADSEGQEGKFYLWQKSVVESLLTNEEYDVIELYYGFDQPANFEQQWHLYIANSLDSIAKQLKIKREDALTLFLSAKQKLAAAREQHCHPEVDRKILTAWNSLAIKALALASDVLAEPRYLQAAQHALASLRKFAWREGQLYVCTRSNITGYLDDYAFLLDALLTLLQIEWRTDLLHFAQEIADTLIAQFTDHATGGFYFTAENQEKVIFRPKSLMDEAIPSGNGVATHALLVLGHLLGESRYLTAAENSLKSAAIALNKYPAEHCSLLLTLKEYFRPSEQIVIRGKLADMSEWIAYCKKEPGRYVFAIPDFETNLPALLATRSSQDNTCAYICKGFECRSVVRSFAELQESLSGT